MVRIVHGEHHALHEPAPRAPGDVEETELERLSIRRQLPLEARPVSAVTIMHREQTISLHVEHSDLMVWRAPATGSRLMQNRGTTRCDPNREIDRYIQNRTLPGTHQGFHFLERLLSV